MEPVDGGVVVHVHVMPRAGRTEVAGRHGDALKVRVAVPPVEGRATEAARLAVAEALAVAPAAVTVVGGERSRAKRLRVDGVDVTEAERRLSAHLGPGSAPGRG